MESYPVRSDIHGTRIRVQASYRTVIFGLGSNLGDRVQNVLSGASAMLRRIEAFRVRHTDVAQVECAVSYDDHGVWAMLSPLYETAPVGGPPQGDYVNAALSVRTNLPAQTLLTLAMAVECEHGRERLVRFGPRTLDVDLLWIDGEVVCDRNLEVPHPRLAERTFALRPLLDLAPWAEDPRSGVAYSDMELPMSGLLDITSRSCYTDAIVCGAGRALRVWSR